MSAFRFILWDRLRAVSLAAVLLAAAALPSVALDAGASPDTPDAAALTTLYKFKGTPKDGEAPLASLAFGAKGALYGTTFYGGGGCVGGCGTIFQLTPADGGFDYKLLFKLTEVQFGGGLNGGIGPTAGLTYDKGLLYGTASVGGNSAAFVVGTVFKITPPSKKSPKGKFQVLHRFEGAGGNDGYSPIGGVVVGPDGALYGTTSSGGQNGAGSVFKLGTDGKGFTVLHEFQGSFNGGPQGDLLFGADGSIYGTTFGGGKYNQGTVFRLKRAGKKWAHAVLYDFKGVNQPGGSIDGANPEGKLALGQDGAIFGTTRFGGESDIGTAWRLTPAAGGKFAYKQIHHFDGDGNIPHSGLIIDADGVLYGTAAGGGRLDGGVVYKLVVAASGKAKYTVLHSFIPRHKDGYITYGGVILKGGLLYGTNRNGGDLSICRDGCGTVFELVL